MEGGTVSHSCFRVLSSSREKRAPTTYPTVARTKIEPSVLALSCILSSLCTCRCHSSDSPDARGGSEEGSPIWTVSSFLQDSIKFRGETSNFCFEAFGKLYETAMLIVMTFWSLFSACKVNILIENLTGQEFKLTRVQTLNPSKSQS